MIRLNILLVFVFAVGLFFSACDDNNEATSSGTTMIEGFVADPVIASAPIPKKPTFLTSIKQSLTIIKSADAQNDEIEIVAFQNGAMVDQTTVSNGMYSVEVPAGGPVNLDFITPNETFSIEINVTPSSRVELDVDLLLATEGPLVDIQKFVINSPKIVIRENESFTFDEQRAVLKIDGDGGDCISSRGTNADPELQNIHINVEELELSNCDNCVFANGNQNVLLNTASNEATASVFPLDFGGIFCSASSDAIKANDAASVSMINENRDGEIIIASANESGIEASGSEAFVEIEPGSLTCQIMDSDGTIAEGGAVVDAPRCVFPTEEAVPTLSVRSDPECPGTNRFLKGAQVVSKDALRFGKYVFDITPLPSNALGMLNGFFLLTASCSGSSNPSQCPPFWGNWNSDHAEIDFEFVPGHTDGGRPLIPTGNDCGADNINCNPSRIGKVNPPRNFVSFNTFAYNKAKQTRASDHQAFYETSTSPFGRRDTYTMYYTPCGVQWSIGSEQGDNPLLYQNSVHINDNQNDLNNFIHTVDFNNIKGKDLYIYINHYSGLERSPFAGKQRPPANTKSDIYSVKYFPIDGGDTCSTSSNNVAGAACSIDSNNKITCKYSEAANFVSDFEKGQFVRNGSPVGSWTDLWLNLDFNLDPIYTDKRNAVYSGTGNPLNMHYRCQQF